MNKMSVDIEQNGGVTFFIHYVVLKDLLVKRAGRRIGSGHASCTLFSRVVCVAGGQEKREQMWIQSSLKAERENIRQGC